MLASINDAAAQQKQKVSIKSLAANTKYTQQHVIDVGDAANHQVRVYEILRQYPSDAPVINSVKVKEWWTRGLSDYTDNSGSGTTYGVFMMENGDKFFVRSSLVAQSQGDGKLNAVTSGTVTGGTGKFSGMKGILSTSNKADPKAGMNEAQTELEYWFDK